MTHSATSFVGLKVGTRTRGIAAASVFAIAGASVLAQPSVSHAAVANVVFERGSYVASPGQPFAHPIRVSVTDDFGMPMEGVAVTFTQTPDAVTATQATLSSLSGVTAPDGTLEITGSAGPLPGIMQLEAKAGTVSGLTKLVDLPTGYSVGETLADVPAQDQDGKVGDIGDQLEKGAYLLVDVCASWCTPCNAFSPMIEASLDNLQVTNGIRLRVATVLMDGLSPGNASTRTSAELWHNGIAPSATVYHADGSTDSDLYRAGFFFKVSDDPGNEGAFPTHLIVRPDGRIVDRVLGYQTKQELIDRVVAMASDSPVAGRSLTIRTDSAKGTARLDSRQVGGGVHYGGKQDPALLSGDFEVSYVDGANAGSFDLPSPWYSNTGKSARFKNSSAPDGPSPVKSASVNAGREARVQARGLGGLDISAPPGPGGILTKFTVVNGTQTTTMCTLYDAAKGSTITHDSTAEGASLVATGGVPVDCPVPVSPGPAAR